MFLTRLRLDLDHRDVQRCLANSQVLHYFVLRLFDGDAGNVVGGRLALRVLHRLESPQGGNVLELIVQSSAEPRPSALSPGFLAADETSVSVASLDALFDRFQIGAAFRFRLRANPTRKIDTKSGVAGVRRNGRRVPIRGDGERIAWLRRHLEAAGMRLAQDLDGNLWFRQRPDGPASGYRKATGLLTHEGHVVEGVLVIVEPTLARRAVITGIGPARAYGFGLLSLAPL